MHNIYFAMEQKINLLNEKKKEALLGGGEARIAKQHDIPVVFGKVVKIKRGYYKVVVDLISEFPNEYEDYQITDIYLKKLEEQIREIPEYYYWTHNRFKHKDKAPKD